MAISTKKSVAAKKAVKLVAKKLPYLPDVPDSAPVVSKTKGKLPEIVAKKTVVAKPEVKKTEKKEKAITLISKVHELLDTRSMTDEEITKKVDADFPGRTLSIAGYRGNVNFARLKKDSKYKILVALVRDESGKLIEKVKNVKKEKKEKGTSKIKLAMASLKK